MRKQVILLILVCVVLFANTLGNSFIWDDKDVIIENRFIKDPGYIPFLFSPGYWQQTDTETSGQYRPIRSLSLVLDYSLWKLNPAGFHFTNLLLHIFNVILVYFLVYALMNVKKGVLGYLSIPFLTALFFAAHPIHVESITWIKNRQDLLSSLFFLSSLLLFIRSTKKKVKFNKTPYLTSLFCFVLALFSKEMAIALPFVLVVYVLCFILKAKMKELTVSTLPFFAIAVFYLVFKRFIIGALVSIEHVHSISLYSNILIVFKTIGYYLRLLIFPFNLTAERMFVVPASFFRPAVIIPAILLLLCSFAIIKIFRYSKLLAFGVLWIFITLMPVSNIVFLARRPIAEQRLYIPSLGFCLIISILINTLSSVKLKSISPKILKDTTILLSIFILIGYSTITIRRNLDWKDSFTFWKKTLQSSPHSPRAHNNLGTEYSAIGKYDEAIKLYNKALALHPEHANAYYNLGSIYKNTGRQSKAIDFYKKTIELNPSYMAAYKKLSEVYTDLGKDELAIELCRRAMRINPRYADLCYNLGNAYINKGEYKEAIKWYEEVVKIDHRYADAYNNLGNAYSDMGDYKKAIDFYQKTLRLDSNYALAHINLSATYLRKKEYKLAIEHFDKAKTLGVVKQELAEALIPHRK